MKMNKNKYYLKNHQKHALLIFVIICMAYQWIYAAESKKIDLINKKVTKIEEEIKKFIPNESLEYLEVNIEPVSLEASPPSLRFYYGNNNLIALYVTVGHETWVKRFHYFFDEHGNPLKYLEIIEGRKTEPERFAIIYETDGSILWKNTDDPIIQPKKIQLLFTELINSSYEFTRY